MVRNALNKIFLSASIPSLDRDIQYYETADIIAIRDSVRALATVVVPNAHLVWGGHPSITPLIRYVMNRMNTSVNEHVTLYQSRFFEDKFPEENLFFEHVVYTDSKENREESLLEMRTELMKNNDFKAAIFIGGMEGVLEEYELYKSFHPDSLILPIASTGGASVTLYEKTKPALNNRLLNDYAYMSLFRDLLQPILNTNRNG